MFREKPNLNGHAPIEKGNHPEPDDGNLPKNHYSWKSIYGNVAEIIPDDAP